ncbi:MAG: hypothetical protein LBO20_10465, partial [Bifidobacteriaceae bacterium]|nr:hypothetical protein [Bifidobacteriaceae bacterium]
AKRTAAEIGDATLIEAVAQTPTDAEWAEALDASFEPELAKAAKQAKLGLTTRRLLLNIGPGVIGQAIQLGMVQGQFQAPADLVVNPRFGRLDPVAFSFEAEVRPWFTFVQAPEAETPELVFPDSPDPTEQPDQPEQPEQPAPAESAEPAPPTASEEPAS